MIRRLRRVLVLSACFGPFASIATATTIVEAPDLDASRPWSEVLEIRAQAEKARVAPYDFHNGTWMLAPDGRYVVVADVDEDHAFPATAMLGRYAIDGNWIELEWQGMAHDFDGMSPEARARYEAWKQEMQAAYEAESAELVDDEPDASEVDVEATLDAEAADADEEMADDARRQRFLRVPYRGGELLVPDQMLTMIASGWRGDGPLELMAAAWRIPGFSRDPDDHSFEFSIDDPLHANLPHELARLLRPEAIEARVVEVRETPQDLKWMHQMAQVHLQLDRGERHGLYPEMSVYGLPPDDDVYGRIVEVEADRAVVQVHVQRFSPREQPTLPSVGLRMTTRPLKSGACALDYSAALRGSVSAPVPATDAIDWDAEGFAWIELAFDQGGVHGLSLGDRLYAEDDEIDGEGRVIVVESSQSRVLWRVQRYDEEQEITLPQQDSKLVTPAWRRAERDVFGMTPGLQKAAVSE